VRTAPHVFSKFFATQLPRGNIVTYDEFSGLKEYFYCFLNLHVAALFAAAYTQVGFLGVLFPGGVTSLARGTVW